MNGDKGKRQKRDKGCHLPCLSLALPLSAFIRVHLRFLSSPNNEGNAMKPFNPTDLQEVLTQHQPPCVSLYLPTSRSYPDSQQGPIQYKNLLRRAEEGLRQGGNNGAGKAVLDKLWPLADDAFFWTHRADGLAVFGSPD